MKLNTIFAKQLNTMIIDLNLEERSWVAICLEEKINSAEKNFEATKDCYWSDQVETLTKITKKL